MAQWRSQPKIFLGFEMFDFRRATAFSLGYRLSKRKMTIILKILGGMPPQDTLFHPV